MEQRFLDWYELLRRLKEHGVDFVVIGGVAAALRGSPVATYDLDVCAPLNETNVPRILAAIADLDPRFRFRPDKMRLPVDPNYFRGFNALNLETTLGACDILGDLPGIGSFEELADKTTQMNVGGFTCRVLDIDTLIASKSFAGREKDKPYLAYLEAVRKQDKKQPGLFDSPEVPPEP
jgi:hypothetical protein